MPELKSRKDTLRGRVQHRDASVSSKTLDQKSRTVDVVFSSEVPVRRQDTFGSYLEVLSHAPGAVRMSRLNDDAAAYS